MKKTTFLLLTLVLITIAGNAQHSAPYQSCKPYTRWWWFAGIIRNEDVRDQLNWLKSNNFGGVEIAFIYPVKRNPKAARYPWLGKEWQGAVRYAKMYADSIGLGCDFTFGTLWPFGGTFVTDADRTQIWGKPGFKQPLRLSWTHPDTGNVLNHLDRHAFERYATVMGNALAPALKGTASAIFCDSWEVETKHLWTKGFDSIFRRAFLYDIRPFMDSIYAPRNAGPRYDYMKLLSQMVLNEFYIPFAEKAHRLGAFSRVQCSGAPVDLIAAYASVDVPETEAMLYEPNFTKIVSSAAALSGKNIVSSETFTCLYGWPAKHFRKEQTADLKLVCDALFSNGVNQVFWHGMPYNPVGCDTNYFYATVHVGKTGNLTDELSSFNSYMTKVSEKMRFGKPCTGIAVYLPLEDSWIAGEYLKELQLPWSWGAYELRYEHFNPELKGYQPLWINNDFLGKGVVQDKALHVNDLSFAMLYVDAKALDVATIKTLLKLASEGLPVCLKQIPVQAGQNKTRDFDAMLQKLKALPNVLADFQALIHQSPLVTGDTIPGFWCRTDGKSATIFFANPKAGNLTYPVRYGQSYQDSAISLPVVLHFGGNTVPVELTFKPYQSLILTINEKGRVEFEDIYLMPNIPSKE
ncbi:MAG: glycosyl hydrolase [Bacteroidetes bacterium]|nr:glycosyl hydrolase [Bacteroidota bacterium]